MTLLRNKKYILILILLLFSSLYAYQYINQGDVHKDLELAKQYYNQGVKFLENNKNKEALKFFNKVLEIHPKSTFKKLYVGKAIAFENLGEYQNAIDNYNIAIKLDNNCSLSYLNKGVALSMLGRNLEAIESFDKVIKLNPNSSNAYNNKGAALGYLNKYQEAINNYNKAIELDPKNFEPYKNKFCPLYNLKRYEEAVETCDKAIELEPNRHDIQEVINNRIKALNKLEEIIRNN